jgi:hypothetical protein
MPKMKSLDQKKQEVLENTKKRWENNKLLKLHLEERLKIKMLIEEEQKKKEMKKKMLLELLSKK